MMMRLIFIVLTLGISLQTYAQQSESDFVKLIHAELGGQREVSVTSGYVDLLTDDLAIEVDFASKWKEAIGQSLWYGLQTNRQPAIVLIKRRKTDQKYVIQLGSALEYAGLANRVRVLIWPDDFKTGR